jgi:hypothetical protein
MSIIMQPKTLKHSVWTQEENGLLIDIMQSDQEKSWRARAVYFPKKTANSLREHWNNSLNPSLDRSSWREGELLKLKELAKTVFNEKRRVFCWKRIKCNFPGRSTNSIKKTWNNRFKAEKEKLLKSKPLKKETETISLDEKNKNKRNFEEMESSLEKKLTSYLFAHDRDFLIDDFDSIELPENLSEVDLNFFNP